MKPCRLLPVLCLGLVSFGSVALSATAVKEYVESIKVQDKGLLTKSQKAIAEKMRAQAQDAVKVEGANLKNIRKKKLAFEAPGFMSARQIPTAATVIGPITNSDSIRINDTVYLRWTGVNPKEGEVFATVTPALILQNKEEPTDFEIGVPKDMNNLPQNYQQAGYLYEVTGLVRITQIAQGMVEARVINLRGQLKVGDRLMPPLPVYTDLPSVYGDGTLTASIVAGSPVDRLSTTIGSTIYINRGMRDGVKLGQVFTALEGIKLESPVHETPQKYMGTAKVIYVSDAYSTAMITQQFDLIRIGSLLRADTAAASIRESTQENLSNMEALPVDPRSQAIEGPLMPDDSSHTLSELDMMENSVKNRGLTPAERIRLNELHNQAKETNTSSLPESSEDAAPDAISESAPTDGEAPLLPAFENSFATTPAVKKDAKKDPKKAKDKRRRDEEHLNEMMQVN